MRCVIIDDSGNIRNLTVTAYIKNELGFERPAAGVCELTNEAFLLDLSGPEEISLTEAQQIEKTWGELNRQLFAMDEDTVKIEQTNSTERVVDEPTESSVSLQLINNAS